MIENDIFKRNSGPVKRTPQRKAGMGNRGDVKCSNGDEDMVVGVKQPSRMAFGEVCRTGIVTGSENVPPLGSLGYTLGAPESVESCKGSLQPREKDMGTMPIYEDLVQPISHSEEPPPQEPRCTSKTADSAPPIEADYISQELMMALSYDEKGTAEQQQQQQQPSDTAVASCLPRPWGITETTSQSKIQPPPPPAMIAISEGEEEVDNTPLVSAATTKRVPDAQPQYVPAKPSILNDARGQRYGVRIPPPGAPMAVGIVPQDKPCRPPELHMEEFADDNVCQAESTWKATTQVEAGALPDPSCSEHPVRPRVPLEEVHIESFPDGGLLVPKESMPKFTDSQSMVKRRRQSVELFENEIIRVKKELRSAQEEGERLRQVAFAAEAKAAELLNSAESKAAAPPPTGPELLDGTLKLLEACKDADAAKAEADIALKRENDARKEADEARMEANEARKDANKAQCFARLARIESELAAADMKVRMDKLSITQRALQVERLLEMTTFKVQVSSQQISTASGAAAIASLAKQAFEGAFEVESKAQALEKNSRTLQAGSRALCEKLKAQEEEALKAQIERDKEISRAEALRKMQEEKEKELEDSSQRLIKEASTLRAKLETLEKDVSQAQKEREEEAMKARAAREEQESRARNAEAEASRAHEAWEKQISKAREADKKAEKYQLDAEELHNKLAADQSKNLEIQADLERKASKARQLREEEVDRADALERTARKLRLDAEELREKLLQQEKETQVQQARAAGLMKERLLLLGEAEDLRLQISRRAFRGEEQPPTLTETTSGINNTVVVAESGRGRASKAARKVTANPSQRDVGKQAMSSSIQRVQHRTTAAAANMTSFDDTTENPATHDDEIQKDTVVNQVASDPPKIGQATVEVKRKCLLSPAAQRRYNTTERTMNNASSSSKLGKETVSNEVGKRHIDQCGFTQSHVEDDDSDASINSQLSTKKRKKRSKLAHPARGSGKRGKMSIAHSHEQSSPSSPLNEVVHTESSSSANIQQMPPRDLKKKKVTTSKSSGRGMMNIGPKKQQQQLSKEGDNDIISQSGATPTFEGENNTVPSTTKKRPSRKAAAVVSTYWEGEPPSPCASSSRFSSDQQQHATHNDDSRSKSKEKVNGTNDNAAYKPDDIICAAASKPTKSTELHRNKGDYPPKGKPKDHGSSSKNKTTIPSLDNSSSRPAAPDGGSNEEVRSNSKSANENKKKKNMLDDESRWDIDSSNSPGPVAETEMTNNKLLPLKHFTTTQERSSIHVRKLSSVSSTPLLGSQPSLHASMVRGETKEVSLKSAFQGAYQKLPTTKFGTIRSGGSSLLGSFRPPKLAKRKF